MNFRKQLSWSEYRLVLLANSLIALLLWILDFGPEPGTWFREFGINFIFAQCIGGSIYVTGGVSNFARSHSPLFRILSLPIVFALGGLLGTFLAWGLSWVLFGFAIQPGHIKVFLIRITLFNVFIAGAVYSYFVLRDKLRQAVVKLAEKEVNEQRLLRLKTTAELQALRTKVNPHFLFNTLNSIASLIPIDPQKAEATVQKLAHLFRYALDSSGVEMVKLADELKLLREYLDIEKLRFGNRLTYKISMDSNVSDFLIPGMLLQPLVENSIKHGITPNQVGGHIELRCRLNERFCAIEVLDTGRGFDALEVEEGFGLSGVRERLRLHYGNNHTLQISGKSGTRILIRVPSSKLAVTDNLNGKDHEVNSSADR